MEELELYFDVDDYNSYLIGEVELEEFLEQIFIHGSDHDDIGGGYQADIEGFLLRDHVRDGGAPTIDSCDFFHEEFDVAAGEGKVTFDYTVRFTFTCADMNSEHSRHETVRFKVDRSSGILTLYFPVYEQPTTADEF